MKKICIVLCIALCLGLAGCQNPTAAPQATTAAPSSSPLATIAPTQGATEPVASPAATQGADAVTASPEPTPENAPDAPAVVEEMEPIFFDEAAPVSCDLDGDGTEEAISIVAYETEYDPQYALQVNEALYKADFYYAPAGMLCDLDGDSRVEIFFTGDMASDDYATWCLSWDGAALQVIPFMDNTGQTGDEGQLYGRFVESSGDSVLVESWLYTLGTWRAQRLYTLAGSALIGYQENPWMRPEDVMAREDLWDDGMISLQTKTELSYLPLAVSAAGDYKLPTGTRLVIVGTDTKSFVDFITQDGTLGRFWIEPGQTHGVTVSGVPEDDAFEALFYAG